METIEWQTPGFKGQLLKVAATAERNACPKNIVNRVVLAIENNQLPNAWDLESVFKFGHSSDAKYYPPEIQNKP